MWTTRRTKYKAKSTEDSVEINLILPNWMSSKFRKSWNLTEAIKKIDSLARPWISKMIKTFIPQKRLL